MKLIRNYIRKILTESSMVPTSTLKDSGYAIWHSYNPASKKNCILLYDMNKFLKKVAYVKNRIKDDISSIDIHEAEEEINERLAEEFEAILVNSSLAGIIITKPKDGLECNGAHVVEVSAGWKGFGPTIYDLAMSIADHGLIADRNEVSQQANNVWKHYFENPRNNIKIEMLDHYKQQWTSKEEDDCQSSADHRAKRIYDYGSHSVDNWKKDPMNYSYNTDYALGDFMTLVNAHYDKVEYRIEAFEEYFDDEDIHGEVIWDFFDLVRGTPGR